ncbi:UNVERIFIED_CONTAM: hypothetical protein DES50_10180 [Williamsia faeni]
MIRTLRYTGVSIALDCDPEISRLDNHRENPGIVLANMRSSL